MSATLLSAFYDLDFLHKTEKSLAGLSLGGVLDTRAVGAPLACAPGCPRRSPGRPPEPASRERVPPPARPAPASARYKTELCRPFEERGACKYGDKCQFAHGPHELRSLARHPKYKTELCRTYHSSGLCPYGPRCHFIHNADERRPGPRLHHSLSFPDFAAPPPPPRAPGARRSPPDSPQPGRDRHRSGSLSPGSRSGSYSPGPDPGRRLPIFSRLSVSDD